MSTLHSPVFSHRHILVLPQCPVPKASISIHKLEEQEILSFKLLSERFRESHCNLLRLLFITFSYISDKLDEPVRRLKRLLLTETVILAFRNSRSPTYKWEWVYPRWLKPLALSFQKFPLTLLRHLDFAAGIKIFENILAGNFGHFG